MTKRFENDHGDRFQFVEDLQTLTAPIYICLEYRLFHRDWSALEDIDLEDIEATTHGSLVEAAESEDWMAFHVYDDMIERRDAYIEEYEALPFAVLEIHPEHSPLLHSIVPGDETYRTDIHEPRCGLDVAAGLGFMVEVGGVR